MLAGRDRSATAQEMLDRLCQGGPLCRWITHSVRADPRNRLCGVVRPLILISALSYCAIRVGSSYCMLRTGSVFGVALLGSVIFGFMWTSPPGASQATIQILKAGPPLLALFYYRATISVTLFWRREGGGTGPKPGWPFMPSSQTKPS